VSLTRRQEKMATMFFNGTELHIIAILPQNQKMDAECSAEHKAYYTIIGFDLLSDSKKLSIEKMRCTF
jgi:hypothetical protein